MVNVLYLLMIHKKEYQIKSKVEQTIFEQLSDDQAETILASPFS